MLHGLINHLFGNNSIGYKIMEDKILAKRNKKMVKILSINGEMHDDLSFTVDIYKTENEISQIVGDFVKKYMEDK